MSEIDLQNGLSLRDMVMETAGPDETIRPDRTSRGTGSQAQPEGPPEKTRPVSPVVFAGLVRLAEFGLMLATGFGTYLLYVVADDTQAWIHTVAVPVISVLAVFVFQTLGIYNAHAFRRVARQNARVAPGWTLVFAAALAALFLAKLGPQFSRGWLSLWFGLGLLTLFLFRGLLGLLAQHWTRQGRLERRVVIVGGGTSAATLIDALKTSPDVRVCGIFDDRGDDRSPAVVAGLPKLGTVSDLVEFARRTRIDLLIVSLPITAETRVLQMLKKLWVLPVDIRLSAHSNKLRLRPRSYSYIGHVPMLDVFDKPMSDWDYVQKWLLDRLLGGLLLLLASPVMALVALAIRLDSRGPVFFKQHRYGFNNELIEVFKFRSMYVDQCDATASRLVTKGDPRVTPVGRFIRRTSLDEPPQLINVAVKGNLSLVGPRPHAVHAKAANRLYNDVVDGYFARHRVKPGITGWAQVNGWRGETDTPEKIQRRVEYDLDYIENWSVLFDLYILAITPFSLLNSENAY